MLTQAVRHLFYDLGIFLPLSACLPVVMVPALTYLTKSPCESFVCE